MEWTKERLELAFRRYAVRCFAVESRLTVDELAATLGISVRTLHRLSNELLGCSPGAYLRDLRRGYAAKLLQQSSLTTAEIAYRAGYGTRRSIFRDFLRETGKTPRQAEKPDDWTRPRSNTRKRQENETE